MKNRILFLLIYFVLIVSFIITGAYYLLVLLVILTSLILVSLLSMFIFSNAIQIHLKEVRKETYFVYKSKGLPIGKLTVNLNIENVFFEEIFQSCFDVILGESQITTKLNFNQNNLGKYVIHSQTFILTDILGLFRKEISTKVFNEKIQYPHIKLKSYEQKLINEKVIVYQSSKSDDYDIREYRIGDSLKDIHYKISYKLSKYMIKEKHKNQGNDLSFVLDLSGNNDECEKVFAYLKEVILDLQVYNEVCLVKWISNDNIYEQKVKDIDDLNQCINRILSMPKCKERVNVKSTWMITPNGLK